MRGQADTIPFARAKQNIGLTNPRKLRWNIPSRGDGGVKEQTPEPVRQSVHRYGIISIIALKRLSAPCQSNSANPSTNSGKSPGIFEFVPVAIDPVRDPAVENGETIRYPISSVVAGA